jgi:hypothetical protein
MLYLNSETFPLYGGKVSEVDVIKVMLHDGGSQAANYNRL